MERPARLSPTAVSRSVVTPYQLLSNLDLTQASVVAAVQLLPTSHLTVNSKGNVTGGSFTLLPGNIDPIQIFGFNIPQKVTFTGQDFAATSPITVNSLNNAVIGGVVNFSTAGSQAVINSLTPVVVSGQLTSSGGLSVNLLGSAANSSFTNSGSVTASAGSFTLQGAAGLTVNGSGTYATGNNAVFQALTGNLNILPTGTGTLAVSGVNSSGGNLELYALNGQVNVNSGATVTASGTMGVYTGVLNNQNAITSVGAFSAAGANGLAIYGSSGVITAPTINLSSGTGALTSAQNQLLGTVNASGYSVTIFQPGNLVLGANNGTTGGDFIILATGSISDLATTTISAMSTSFINGGRIVIGAGMTGTVDKNGNPVINCNSAGCLFGVDVSPAGDVLMSGVSFKTNGSFIDIEAHGAGQGVATGFTPVAGLGNLEIASVTTDGMVAPTGTK